MFSGPLGVTLFFCILILITWISNRFILCFPKLFSKLVVWWGLSAICDPYMVAVVDLATRESTGDILKLYNYYNRSDGAGFAGILIVLIIYGFLFILNLLIFYNYIIFHHMDARLQDIYVRLQGNPKAYFIPFDNEISLKHLLWAYHTGIKNSFRICVNKFKTITPKKQEKMTSCLQISQYDTKTTLKHW